jgi:hypothetical protein
MAGPLVTHARSVCSLSWAVEVEILAPAARVWALPIATMLSTIIVRPPLASGSGKR